MSEAFIGELRLFGFDFAPRNWAFCNGQLLAINTNQALFSILGTTYGGNGTTTFALPDLRGRAAAHVGNQFSLGQSGGEVAHTLLTNEMPTHNHLLSANNTTAPVIPAGAVPDNTKATALGLASTSGTQTAPIQLYGTGSPDRTMSPDTLATAGSTQPHPNQQPYLTLNWCICLFGIFPSRN